MAREAMRIRGIPELDLGAIELGSKLFHGFWGAFMQMGLAKTLDSIKSAGGVRPGGGQFGRGVYTYPCAEHTEPYAAHFAAEGGQMFFVSLVLDVGTNDNRIKHVDGFRHMFGNHICLIETDVPVAPCGFVVLPAKIT